MYPGDEDEAPTRLNRRALTSFLFRLGLYGLGTYIVCSNLIFLLSAWDLLPSQWGLSIFLMNLDPAVVSGVGIASLLLAGIGLFYFFRRGMYRVGLRASTYAWWLIGTLVGIFVLGGAIQSLVPSTDTELMNYLGGVWALLCGLDMMIIAYVRPRKVPARSPSPKEGEDLSFARLAEPAYTISDLILSEGLLSELKSSVDIIRVPQASLETGIPLAEEQVTAVALHLYGKPGTGKTLAAHALADYLGRQILVIAYADLLSHSFLEMNRKLKGVFDRAARRNALLLIDNADPLLSTTLDMSISSQLRVCLEQFRGVAVFTAQTMNDYNKAFERHLRHIHIPLPDEDCREQFWKRYLSESFLQASELQPALLARRFGGMSGYEIKQSIAEAIHIARSAKKPLLELSDLERIIDRQQKQRVGDDDLYDTSIERSVNRNYGEGSPNNYTWEQLIVNKSVEDQLMQALEIIHHESTIFDEWGLRTIEPKPRTALNFFGPPGTGKTLAAHALAHYLNQPIVVANYGEIASPWIGDEARNTITLFRQAARKNAVLFIDEADAMLTKRITNITHSADKHWNALSNQLLVCIEQFHGLVIFATNIIEAYDPAFETRMQHIHFPMPDEDCRRRIWDVHLPAQLPCAGDVKTTELARLVDDICGRDIKNAVIAAAAQVHREERKQVGQGDLLAAIRHIKASRISSQQKRSEVDHKQLRETIRQQLGLEKRDFIVVSAPLPALSQDNAPEQMDGKSDLPGRTETSERVPSTPLSLEPLADLSALTAPTQPLPRITGDTRNGQPEETHS